ncbi:MAG: hypothetical protein WC829_13075 [Hyphomicrobium sp.]|jgi:hypothetical protein
MRPQRHDAFSSRTATKLVDLELIAALLERDATNNRAVFAERGADLQPVRSATAGVRRRRPGDDLARAVALARRSAASVVGIVLHARVRKAVGMAAGFIADVIVVLSSVLAAAVLAAAAFLIAAPPL